jgi:hypothetical protein
MHLAGTRRTQVHGLQHPSRGPHRHQGDRRNSCDPYDVERPALRTFRLHPQFSLLEQSWDPFYKIGKEHLDFYLAQKQLGHWRFAVSLDVEIGHHPEGAQRDYKQFRHGERVKVSERYFLQKFGIEEVVEGRKFDDGWDRNTGSTAGAPKSTSWLSRAMSGIRNRF